LSLGWRNPCGPSSVAPERCGSSAARRVRVPIRLTTARVQRKVRVVGTVGRADGLTKAQAGCELHAGACSGYCASSPPSHPQPPDGKIVEVSAKPGAAYAYRLTGGGPVLKMGCADPYLWVESNRRLSTKELREILRDESAGTQVPGRSLAPGVVSIGWRCPEARPPASPSAQAQADADGWNMEKWRKARRRARLARE